MDAQTVGLWWFGLVRWFNVRILKHARGRYFSNYLDIINILDADDLDYNSMLAMPSADVLAQLIALSQMNAANSGNKKKKKNKRPVATKAPVVAKPAAPAATSSKGSKKKKKQKKTTSAPTTQAPTTVQVSVANNNKQQKWL